MKDFLGKESILYKFLLIVIIAVILSSSPALAESWKPVEGRIMTQWAEEIDPQNALPEYPRPAMIRENWLNLNGLWDYAIVEKNTDTPNQWNGSILVPYPVESALSGVGKRVGADKALWYRRQFPVPPQWQGQRILLHFGAVDWQSTIWVNGKEVGTHKGGYDPFTLDITDALKADAAQEIIIRVWDPTDQKNSPIPRGKQLNNPNSIWYTPVTGIWQTVWLEPVPKACIRSIKVTPDLDKGQIQVQVAVEGVNSQTYQADKYFLSVVVSEGKVKVASLMGSPFQTLTLTIDNAKEWSPEAPFLYDLTVNLTQEDRQIDEVKSYLGMRKIEVKKDKKGINRLFLNNKPVFQFGPLDQGWWPDGLYTAPTDEALRYDIEMTKAWGFNMLRKHVKVEPQRLYYWCDKLGVLIWQDMPSCIFNRDAYSDEELQEIDAQWETEWKAIIDALYHHPSIVMWVPFNEGWGQYDTERITAWTKAYDPSRLVNNASGWTDKGVGDVHDIHNYPNPDVPPLEAKRASVLGEYGGLGMPVKDHLWEIGGNWGYQTYQDMSDLEQRYVVLTQDLYQLKEKGLAAAVYTQTTDVEVEVNGLMTYDRKVIKLNPERFAPLNKGYLPPKFTSDQAIFTDSIEVELIGEKRPQIRYTLDGLEPTKSSALYTQPIHIEQTTTVKACCFWPDGTASPSVNRKLRKVKEIKAVIANVQNAGLKYACFEGQWNSLPDFSTLRATQTGIVKTINLSCVNKRENFALKFTGFIKIPLSGVYQFTTNSDDGTILFLGGSELINNDGVHGMNEVLGEIALEAGWHPIELVYFQGVGGLGLDVSWQGPGFQHTQISGDMLGH